MSTIQLREIAIVRSGDKGNHANIGVVAKSSTDFEFLKRTLTTERIAEHFRSLAPTRVERFELPAIFAFNFFLRDVLDGGAQSRSLRFDTQGKLLGTALGDLKLDRET